MTTPSARRRSDPAGWRGLVLSAISRSAFACAAALLALGSLAAASENPAARHAPDPTRRAHPLRRPAPAATPIPGQPGEWLWPRGAPDAVGTAPADKPSLAFYFPDSARANGAAVIVCPGGAYGMLARNKEGVEPSLWLQSLGVHAFLLDYRLGPVYHHPVEMGDALRAVRWVRANAARLHIDPRRIGMLGFSAGGHMAAMAATHFDLGDGNSHDPVERASSRPDFQILIYPVISMQAPFAHRASRINLLGRSPDPATLDFTSVDQHVTDRTPPAFLVHAESDPIVSFANSQAYAEALRNARVPVEFLGFVQGGHAFGLAAEKTGDPGQAQLATWPAQCAAWLDKMGFMGKSPHP